MERKSLPDAQKRGGLRFPSVSPYCIFLHCTEQHSQEHLLRNTKCNSKEESSFPIIHFALLPNKTVALLSSVLPGNFGPKLGFKAFHDLSPAYLTESLSVWSPKFHTTKWDNLMGHNPMFLSCTNSSAYQTIPFTSTTLFSLAFGCFFPALQQPLIFSLQTPHPNNLFPAPLGSATVTQKSVNLHDPFFPWPLPVACLLLLGCPPLTKPSLPSYPWPEDGLPSQVVPLTASSQTSQAIASQALKHMTPLPIAIPHCILANCQAHSTQASHINTSTDQL